MLYIELNKQKIILKHQIETDMGEIVYLYVKCVSGFVSRQTFTINKTITKRKRSTTDLVQHYMKQIHFTWTKMKSNKKHTRNEDIKQQHGKRLSEKSGSMSTEIAFLLFSLSLSRALAPTPY